MKIKSNTGAPKKKLRLKKRVLVDLSNEQLDEVAGGHPHPPTCAPTCPVTCGNNETCPASCGGTCGHTCALTCGYTCPETCDTCGGDGCV